MKGGGGEGVVILSHTECTDTVESGHVLPDPDQRTGSESDSAITDMNDNKFASKNIINVFFSKSVFTSRE